MGSHWVTVIVHFAQDHEENATKLLQRGETRRRQEWQQDCNDVNLDAYEETQVAAGWRMHITVVDHYRRALFDQLAQATMRKQRTTLTTHYAVQDGFGQIGVECAIIGARVIRTVLMQLAQQQQVTSRRAGEYVQACLG